MAKISQTEFNALSDYYLANPTVFVKEVLGASAWEVQNDIINSVFQYKYTAVKTCNAVGKSYIAARIALAYLLLHSSSIVVTTAPTWRQVTDVFWREFATAYKQAEQISGIKLSEKEVRQAGLTIGTDWYAVGVSTKRPENFFGYHANHILVVVDEAGGVEEPIFLGVKAITPNANARVLYIGNPTTPGGTFFDQFDMSKNLPVKRFTVSAFDTPNFTANGIETIDDLLELFTPPEGVDAADHVASVNESLKQPYPALIAPSVAYERYLEWGTDSPAWESLIMGEFPSQADQALIPINFVDQAMNNYGIDKESGKTFAELSGWNIPNGDPEYGLDIARFGNDTNVFTPRHGGFVEQQVIWSKVDLIATADRVVALIDPYKERLIKIDDTGNGGGTVDALVRYRALRRQAGKAPYNYRISDYNMANSATDKEKFADITSEIYWNLRDWFINKQIALPFDSQLRSELISRRWSITANGKIKVESKDEYRKRTGGKSPDKSDSLALSFANAYSERAEMVLDRVPENLENQHIKPMTSTLGNW